MSVGWGFCLGDGGLTSTHSDNFAKRDIGAAVLGHDPEHWIVRWFLREGTETVGQVDEGIEVEDLTL
ncbi:hypothetical protein N8580_04065 [Akkermansiaceae bacterium]|nr:hypothetical protein [Akkermansiaceae bacterium]MDB4681951.1 hypothetical protein [Akkermansiaceae bacterium]